MAQPSGRAKAAHPTRSAGRRGRPTLDRSQEIDGAIRAAALETFLDVGFEAASMDAIAARAPVSKGTLYARYQGKEHLFRAVVEEEIERLSQKAGEKDYLLPPDVEGRLRHFARMIVEVVEWPQFRALDRLMRSVRAFPELENLWQRLAGDRYIQFLAHDIARAAETRDLTPADCRFLANLFVHGILGWHRAQTEQRTVPAPEVLAYADRVIDVIMMDIRRRCPAASST